MYSLATTKNVGTLLLTRLGLPSDVLYFPVTNGAHMAAAAFLCHALREATWDTALSLFFINEMTAKTGRIGKTYLGV